MDVVLDYNGTEISSIPVINRPSYFLVNNYGRESYMTILEPIGQFQVSPERKVLAAAYKNVSQLIAGFREKAPTGSTEQGYSRKDTMEVFFMGFTWRWRPNHKSFYGAMSPTYELLPLVARWIVLTGAVNFIDNQSEAYLPIKYHGGTSRGFGMLEANPKPIDNSKEANEKHIAEVEAIVASRTLQPMAHSLAGSVARAAQMNVVPKEAFRLYDTMMSQQFSDGTSRLRLNPGHQYVVQYQDSPDTVKFLGAVYGGAPLPNWTKLTCTMGEGSLKVTIVEITASDINEAENLMVGLIKKPVH
ncbi:MAG: hypothetical protein NC131_18575 [Roseburia sp.]|nr:hypothetical protein [Roseburia sp.]